MNFSIIVPVGLEGVIDITKSNKDDLKQYSLDVRQAQRFWVWKKSVG